MKRSTVARSGLLLSLYSTLVPPAWAGDEAPPPASDKAKEQPKAKGSPSVTAPGKIAKQKAADAQKRAKEAHDAGQHLSAERLETVYATWLKVAKHQEAAAKLEAEAADIERKTLELKAKARRAHSLVEQTETRRARALSRLRELGLSDTSETKTEASTAPSSQEEKPANANKATSK